MKIRPMNIANINSVFIARRNLASLKTKKLATHIEIAWA